MNILEKAFNEFSNQFDIFRPLNIGDIELRIPIVQGGMGVGISRKSLVSSVTRAGGLGVIASVGLGHKIYRERKQKEKDNKTLTYERKTQIYAETNKTALVTELQETRALVGELPIGVNIMYALTDYSYLVEGAIEGGADVIFSGAGIPKELPELVGDSKIKLVPIVSSYKVAQMIISHWEKEYSRRPDAIVIEGPLAGGHLGFSKKRLNELDNDTTGDTSLSLKNLVQKLKSKIPDDIPVIAAGGIFTGKDILEALDYGADGVQMATRFVTTAECDAHDNLKHVFVNTNKSMLIASPVGLPGRAAFLAELPQPFNCEYKCLKTCHAPESGYCIADMLVNAAYEGDIEHGLVFTGANVAKIKKEEVIDENGDFISVADLIKRLHAEALLYNLSSLPQTVNESIESFINNGQILLNELQTRMKKQAGVQKFGLEFNNKLNQFKVFFNEFKHNPSPISLCEIEKKMQKIVDAFSPISESMA